MSLNPVVDLTGAVLEPVQHEAPGQPAEYRGLLRADRPAFFVQGTRETWGRFHGLLVVATAQDAPLAVLHCLWRLNATLNQQQIDLLRIVLFWARGLTP